MKYRTPANGETVERDDIPESLVAAGIYVPLEEPKAEEHDGLTKHPKPRR